MGTRCWVCGAELTDPDSVDRGIGPVCAKKREEMDVKHPVYPPGQLTVRPSEIHVEGRFRKTLGDLRPLAYSIARSGLIHKIVVTDDNHLIIGERRLEAWKYIHGDAPIPVKRVPIHLSEHDRKNMEIEENTKRKKFTCSEMVAVTRYLKSRLEAEAKKRQGTRTDLGKQLPSESDESYGRTDEIIAEICDTSRDTIHKSKKIVEAYEEDPGRFGALMENVDNEKTSINYAYDVVTRAERHADPPELPEGVYDVVYADPPWNYSYKARGNPEFHYPVMDDEEIYELEVPAADDAVLFLWATNPKLGEALKVIEEWGFTYKTNLCWVKNRIGTGFYVRGKHELLLIATRGKVPTPVNDTRPPSVLEAAVREHSRKPDEAYDLIEKMYPGRKYLELFARGHRMGWTAWGDEAPDGEVA